jgi:hypothetical protein
MDSETLKRDCGDRAEEWYRSLEEQYGWNARFWEQRSLLASAENRHTVAYSYAKKAVSLHEKDSFVWTTLGKVCIRVGLEKRDATGAARFWEGVEALRMSRKISADDGHEWEHPYRTFFSYALAAARNPHLDADRPRLLQEWSDWMRHAQRSVLFAAPPEQAELDSYQRQWLLQAARPEPNA